MKLTENFFFRCWNSIHLYEVISLRSMMLMTQTRMNEKKVGIVSMQSEKY